MGQKVVCTDPTDFTIGVVQTGRILSQHVMYSEIEHVFVHVPPTAKKECELFFHLATALSVHRLEDSSANPTSFFDSHRLVVQ